MVLQDVTQKTICLGAAPWCVDTSKMGDGLPCGSLNAAMPKPIPGLHSAILSSVCHRRTKTMSWGLSKPDITNHSQVLDDFQLPEKLCLCT